MPVDYPEITASKSVQKKHIIITCCLFIVSLIAVACSSPEYSTTQVIDSDGDGLSDTQEVTAGTDPHNTDTDGDGYWDRLDSNPLDPAIPSERILVLDPEIIVSDAVRQWARSNVSEISGEIAALVTSGTPIASYVVANLIETALLEDIKWSIESVDSLPGKDRYSAKVRFAFPLQLEYGPTIVEWDPLEWRQRRVLVDYDVIVDAGLVIDSTIDISSFQLTKIEE